MNPKLIGLLLVIVGTGGAVVRAQAPLQMPTARHSSIGSEDLPAWLATAPHVRLKVPSGVRLELLTMTVISTDQGREAALIGLFRNRTRNLEGASLTLAYIGPDGESILRRVPNSARVTAVAAESILPFRFPLVTKAELPLPAATFEISLDEQAGGARIRVPAGVRGRFSTRAQRGGMSLAGDIDIGAEPGSRGPDRSGTALTLIVWDKQDRLLDVLSGTADSAGQLTVHRFSVHSFVPAAGRVGRVEVFAEQRLRSPRSGS